MSRLIDADTLIKELHYALDGSGFDEDYRDMGIDDIINNQPTAFNVEKIVEQLEELQQYYIYSIDDLVRLKEVKEILKRGGVMTAENIAMLISTILLFIVGFKLGEERGKGENDIE